MSNHEVISLLDDSDDDTPRLPPIKVKSRVLQDKTIEILSDDDEEEDDDNNDIGNRKMPAVKSPKKRAAVAMVQENRSPNPRRFKIMKKSKKSKHHDDVKPKKSKPNYPKDCIDDDDDEIEALDANPFGSAAAASLNYPAAASLPSSSKSNNNKDGEEDGIQLVGSIGNNALTDFPHARENCVLFPFGNANANNNAQHCAQCFCFVCDCVVAQCGQWHQDHCHATYQEARWKQERQRVQQQKLQQQQQQQQHQQQNPVSTARASSNNNNHNPHGTAAWHPPPPHFRRQHKFTPMASVQTLLGAVTRVYPREQTPPAPFATNLRHYQKQSLAFMVDVESSNDANLCWKKYDMNTRGGWLCSEVGMGKSAVVIALVAANPFNPHQPKVLGRKLLKSTVILTSVSLMGQWEDECAKHAPHLKVLRFHNSNKHFRTLGRKELSEADIVISASTFKWKNYLELEQLLFHRIVQDESHLFYSQSVSACASIASSIPSARRWCVTATPMTSTSSELYMQGRFLGIPHDMSTKFCQDPEFLKQFMIRHIKAQQIGGSNALALPRSTTTTQIVRMNGNEKKWYDAERNKSRFLFQRLRKAYEAKWFHLSKSLVYSLSLPLVRENSSKMKALETAIIDLRRRDPNMRAVVFSQMREVLSNARRVISRLGIQLYHFDGGTSSKKRDEAIRKFQSLETPGPAVFCITLTTGSVGITLTAASHVLLMEPCINPSQEIQSAGRIHRLGQTKQVHVTKFVYADSFESNILKLHEKVADGTVQFTANGVGNDALQILLRDV